jgi:hypothetical protein
VEGRACLASGQGPDYDVIVIIGSRLCAFDHSKNDAIGSAERDSPDSILD